MDYIKLGLFCTEKETFNRWVTDRMSETFVNYVFDRRLLSRTMRSSRNSTKTNQIRLRNGLRDEIQMANRHMKRCSGSLAIKEMQRTNTMKLQFTDVGMANIPKSRNNKS